MEGEAEEGLRCFILSHKGKASEEGRNCGKGGRSCGQGRSKGGCGETQHTDGVGSSGGG